MLVEKAAKAQPPALTPVDSRLRIVPNKILKNHTQQDNLPSLSLFINLYQWHLKTFKKESLKNHFSDKKRLAKISPQK